MFNKIKKYISLHKVEIGILLLILIVAAFFRLYKISDYMTFLGDEGRDAIVAKDILHGQFTLLGPRASAGDFFLGPIYYYMMAPFLLLSNYDPVGPAIMVALFGIATVFLVYYVGLKFFNARAGLVAAALYAVSPLVIAYSRSSWNPNLMPFFSLLMLYLLFVGLKKQSWKLFLVVGILLGIAMQLHYLSTFLAVIIFAFVLIGEILLQKKNIFRRYTTHYLEIFVGFLIGFSPFLAFEVRHGFPNIRTIIKFIFEDNASKAYLHTSFFGNVENVYFRLFARLVTKFPPPEQVNVKLDPGLQVLQIATIILAVISIVSLFYLKEKLKTLLLVVWLFFGIFLFGFYKQLIYDYYFGFMFPLPFLMVGELLSKLWDVKKYKKIGMIAATVVFVWLLLLNLSGNPFQFPPNKQKDQAKHIAESIISRVGDKPFNFALLTKGNSDHVYRYFLEIENHTPVTILNPSVDPERKSVTEQLIVVCEYPDCQPLGNPLWEVAGFGRGQIVSSWEVPFVKIFKLTHYGRPQNYSLKKVLFDPMDEYDNSQYGFSFKYPSSFIQTVENDTRGLPKQPVLYLNFRTPDVLAEDKQKPNFDFATYNANTMTISIQTYDDSGLSLEDFLTNYFKGSESDDLKKNLVKSDISKDDAYVYVGTLGQNPSKRYFIKNQNQIYFFTLFAGNDTGTTISPDEEKIFDKLVKSLKFK